MSDCEINNNLIATKRVREANTEDEDLEDNVDFVEIDPKDQVNYISNLKNTQLQEGEVCCLVSSAWYKRWVQYCARLGSLNPTNNSLGKSAPPGPVDNRSILKNGKLVDELVLDVSVHAVPERAWETLVHWYGVLEECKEPIRRLIIEEEGQDVVELYPPQFKIYLVESNNSTHKSDQTRSPIITLSKTDRTADLFNAIKNSLDLSPTTDIQVWTLDEEPETADGYNVSVDLIRQAVKFEVDNQYEPWGLSGEYYCIVEVRDKISAAFPSDQISDNLLKESLSDSSSVSSTSSVFANGFNTLTTSSASTPPPLPSVRRFTRGECGLQNLGNTCFMNSALQCLSNTPQLTKWFLADNYKTDLNRDNPLGMNGLVAEAYGELLKKLWSGSFGSTAPREFKYTIGRFNSSFSGYHQHDTQELLAFLLDGLHEDLNRILKKPYIELPDFDGMEDAEIANRSWDYHRARNDSVIVDLFQGQFKSKLVCKECKNVSVTFDPFMYLSLPLPIKKKSKVNIVYVPYDPSQPLKRVTVTLNKEASIAHLQKEVAKMMSVENPDSLLVIEIFSHKIYKVFAQYEPVATIGTSDTIYVYQLPGSVPPLPKKKASYSYNRYNASDDEDEEKEQLDENQLLVFPVYCATVSKSDSTFSHNRLSQFGDPIVLAIPHKDAKDPDYLYHLISQHVERYSLFKLFEEVKDAKPDVESAEENLDAPPPYDDAVQTEDDPMEIDSEPVQSLIHTPAAVTAAGGKKIEPMTNLFTMKVFSAPRYGRGAAELLPCVQNWTDLVDIRQRAQQQDPVSDPADESNDDDDEEEVEDASALFGTPPAEQPVKPTKVISTGSPGTLIRQGEGILLEWTLKKAQQLFGAAGSGVRVDAWEEIEDLGDPDESAHQTQQNKQVTLSDCLDEFTKEEELSGEDLWYCPKCKKHQMATKKFDLWRMPDILVVHLKRFSHSRTWRDKIDALIDFPTSALDLTERVLSIDDQAHVKEEDRLIYDLYAVDNHYGGLGGGHYTAFAQNFEDKNWYNFDDSHVTKVNVSDVKTTAAYLLFYKRRKLSDNEPSKTVEEIMQEAQEKQQAAKAKLAEVKYVETEDTRGYLLSSDDEQDDGLNQTPFSPPVFVSNEITLASDSLKDTSTDGELTDSESIKSKSAYEELF